MKYPSSQIEKIAAKDLISKFIKYKSKLPYANVNSKNQYLGWVDNFGFGLSGQRNMKLDLQKENDLFLLFVLALVWSRTGPWENSAFFVAYLKTDGKSAPSYWLNSENIEKELDNRKEQALKIEKRVTGHKPRKKISFRKDIFPSIQLLSQNWNKIKLSLEKSEQVKDYEGFIKLMRSIEGLGVGKRRILIKIPLILRELRCQNIYSHISGKVCCVPDARVHQAAKALQIKLPVTSKLENLLKGSAKIYELFGDLYDLPLFAYEDLKKYP